MSATDPLELLASRLDRVREGLHGGAVGVAQLQGAVALLLEDLAQIGGIALQLALPGGRLSLRALQLVTEISGLYSCHLDSPSYQRVVKRTGR